jgi:hypothetical protein
VALVTAPLPVLAAPAGDVIAEAKRLYQEGKGKYDTVDYEGAIDAWTQAYSMLPDDEVEIRSALAYNLAAAREKSFELTGDLVELKRARILLIKYISETKSIMEPGEKLDEMVRQADERLQAIDARLAEAEKAPKPAPKPEPGPSADPEPDQAEPATGTDPEPDPGEESKDEPGGKKGLLYAGVGVAAAGAAAAGVSAAFMARGKSMNDAVTGFADDEEARLAAIQRGNSSNTLAIALGATAGVLLTGGAVLIALGVKRGKKAEKNASVVPAVGPGHAGVVFMGRF